MSKIDQLCQKRDFLRVEDMQLLAHKQRFQMFRPIYLKWVLGEHPRPLPALLRVIPPESPLKQ